MAEAAKRADRVGIVDHGRLLALDSPRSLVAALPGSATIDLTLTGADPSAVRGRLGEVRGVAGVERLDDGDGPTRLRCSCDGSEGQAGQLLPAVLGVGADAGARGTDVALGEPTLEDVFIDLTGRGLR